MQWYIPEDAEERLSGGVYEALQKAQAQGKVRYLGFSRHLNTTANLKELELLGDQVDFSLSPVNAVNPSDDDRFVKKVLPKLVELEVAPLSMKTGALRSYESFLPFVVNGWFLREQ